MGDEEPKGRGFRFLRADEFDTAVARAKGGKGFYKVRVELIGNGKGAFFRNPKWITILWKVECKEGELLCYPSLGSGLYRFDLERLDPNALTQLAQAEPNTFGLKDIKYKGDGFFIANWSGLQIESGEWHYEQIFEIREQFEQPKFFGCVVIPFDLPNGSKVAILIRADASTGKLEVETVPRLPWMNGKSPHFSSNR